jgi:hypothetical protein
MIRRLVARWQDWRRERRIADLMACFEIEMAAGRTLLAREAVTAAHAEARQRSSAQRARMARKAPQ